VRARGGLAGAALVAAPVFVGIAYAAAGAVGLAGAGAAGPTGRHLRAVLGSGAVWGGVWWTTATALAATLLAAAAAVATAVLFRGTAPADRAARLLAVVPLPVPHLVAASCGVLVLGQSGLLARAAFALGLVASPQEFPALVSDPLGVGFVLTLAWKEFPFLALVAFSLLGTRGAQLEEVARTLGGGPWETFRRVTWPTLWRGLLPAAVAVFIFVAGSYEAAFVLAPSDPLPLPAATYERSVELDLGRRGGAYVLALVGLAMGGVAVAAHEWARARGDEG
jgi:putative spermidine/putrescine transport system permease protein